MCPCLYYSDSTSTCHPLLIGDLVFKLNPGPVNGIIPTISFVRGSRKRCGSLRHPQNLINVNCSDPNTRSGGNFNHPLSLCLLNARSVKNKTALLLAYIRDSSADLYDITETWLTDKDASVKAEFCPAGYNFIDHPRTGYRGGSTGLIFRDSLRVKMVDAGGKDSFEFSEWLVNCLGCSLRLLILFQRNRF